MDRGLKLSFRKTLWENGVWWLNIGYSFWLQNKSVWMRMNNPFAIDDEGDKDYNIDVEDKDIKGVTGAAMMVSYASASLQIRVNCKNFGFLIKVVV